MNGDDCKVILNCEHQLKVLTGHEISLSSVVFKEISIVSDVPYKNLKVVLSLITVSDGEFNELNGLTKYIIGKFGYDISRFYRVKLVDMDDDEVIREGRTHLINKAFNYFQSMCWSALGDVLLEGGFVEDKEDTVEEYFANRGWELTDDEEDDV